MDEEESLPLLVARILEVCDASGLTLSDIVLVDDGSSDTTWAVMSQLAGGQSDDPGDPAAAQLRQGHGPDGRHRRLRGRRRRHHGRRPAGRPRRDSPLPRDARCRLRPRLGLEEGAPRSALQDAALAPVQRRDGAHQRRAAARLQLRLQGLPARDLRHRRALRRAASLRAGAGACARLSHRRDPRAPPRAQVRQVEVWRGALSARLSRSAHRGHAHPVRLSAGASLRRHRLAVPGRRRRRARLPDGAQAFHGRQHRRPAAAAVRRAGRSSSACSWSCSACWPS